MRREPFMPTSRSYGDACGIARALDAVGERGALLVVRELLLGPQRFSDLRRALVGASSNVVADRLRELEGRSVVGRRTLDRPPGSWLYELTEWGRELEPILLALGNWGARVPLPAAQATLSTTSVLLFPPTSPHPDPHGPRCARPRSDFSCDPRPALPPSHPHRPAGGSSTSAYGPSEPRRFRCI